MKRLFWFALGLLIGWRAARLKRAEAPDVAMPACIKTIYDYSISTGEDCSTGKSRDNFPDDATYTVAFDI